MTKNNYPKYLRQHFELLSNHVYIFTFVMFKCVKLNFVPDQMAVIGV